MGQKRYIYIFDIYIYRSTQRNLFRERKLCRKIRISIFIMDLITSDVTRCVCVTHLKDTNLLVSIKIKKIRDE